MADAEAAILSKIESQMLDPAIFQDILSAAIAELQEATKADAQRTAPLEQELNRTSVSVRGRVRRFLRGMANLMRPCRSELCGLEDSSRFMDRVSMT